MSQSKVIIMNLHRSIILYFNHDPPPPETSAPIPIPGCWHCHPLPTEAQAQTQNEPKIMQGFISAPFCASLTGIPCSISVPRAIPACLASLGFMHRM